MCKLIDPLPTNTVVFLFTDIVGSTPLWQADLTISLAVYGAKKYCD
jgi:class 3 adenylate cyclase